VYGLAVAGSIAPDTVFKYWFKALTAPRTPFTAESPPNVYVTARERKISKLVCCQSTPAFQVLRPWVHVMLSMIWLASWVVSVDARGLYPMFGTAVILTAAEYGFGLPTGALACVRWIAP